MSLINLKSLGKRKVVDTSTAATIGRVKDLQIDLGRGGSGPHVVAVVVKGKPGGLVPYGDVIGFGADAVTVESAAVLVEDPGALPTGGSARGSRLLNEHGHHLGKVEDLTMDTEDGRIVSVTVDGVTNEGTVLGIGSFAVVIRLQ